MRNIKKSVFSLIMAVALIFSMLVIPANAALSGAKTPEYSGTTPKYIFMFIADGLSYSQLSITSSYLGALQNKVESQEMTITKFPVVGSAATYDSTSYAPDSASTATSYATGYKTLSGVINMDEKKTKTYETITEKLKNQLGYKIGIVSTVNINHATPAAYYGHQPTRGNYYELSAELIASDFDYFAGGKLLDNRKTIATGEDYREDVYDFLMGKGYTVTTTTEEYKALTGSEEKVFIASDDKDFSDDTGAMHYEIDRPKEQPSLADYVKTGINYLSKDNNKGFFMMVEGGKIDWACHANDAAAAINDVLAFDKAVQVAVDFYNKYPKETLIIVTGDHETGGLSIGFAGTAYDTHLEILANQKISFVEFDKQVANYRKNNTKFDDVMKDIKANFGLITSKDADAAKKPLLVLTDYELATIKTSYEKSMLPSSVRNLSQAENVLYGTYEPLTVTLTHILNQKAGIGWTSYSHTGVPVPVFAMGAGQDLFNSFYDNTQVFFNLKALTKVK